MANHPSALKRHRQSLKRREAHRSRKSRIHTLVRAVDTAIGAGDQDAAAAGCRDASRALAKAASKGTLHKKTAARRASRLARRVAKASATD